MRLCSHEGREKEDRAFQGPLVHLFSAVPLATLEYTGLPQNAAKASLSFLKDIGLDSPLALDVVILHMALASDLPLSFWVRFPLDLLDMAALEMPVVS